MRAIQISEVKTLKAIEIPNPGNPAAGEALVRTHRMGVCGTDISCYLGKFPFFDFPRIPGHELGVEVIEGPFPGGTGAQVHLPPVQVGLKLDAREHRSNAPVSLVGAQGRVGRPAAHHDHRVAVFPAVDDVEHVAGLEGEPGHVGVGPEPRNDPEAGGDFPMEHRNSLSGLAEELGVEEHGKVVQHTVVGRHADVVGTARARQCDVGAVDSAVGANNPVCHVGRAVAVPKPDQVAGRRVHLCVGGCSAQGAVKVPGTEGVKGQGIEGHRHPGLVPEREQLALNDDEVSVGGVFERSTGQGEVEWSQHPTPDGPLFLVFLGPTPGLNRAVSVLRPSVVKPDAVHHAVAVKPVVAVGRGVGAVGSVAKVGPAQLLGQLALDLQLGGVHLVDRRRKEAVQVGVVDRLDPVRGTCGDQSARGEGFAVAVGDLKDRHGAPRGGCVHLSKGSPGANMPGQRGRVTAALSSSMVC